MSNSGPSPGQRKEVVRYSELRACRAFRAYKILASYDLGSEPTGRRQKSAPQPPNGGGGGDNAASPVLSLNPKP